MEKEREIFFASRDTPLFFFHFDHCVQRMQDKLDRATRTMVIDRLVKSKLLIFNMGKLGVE